VREECAERALRLDDIELNGVALGVGSCGVVHKAVIKKTQVPVAVKRFRVEDRDKCRQFVEEIKVLTRLSNDCPNLVQVYECRNSGHNPVHIVMEFMDLGSLADLNERLRTRGSMGVPSDLLACITRQIIGGLEHLHSIRCLHHDITPGNVLHNTGGEVKLSDFGYTKELGIFHSCNLAVCNGSNHVTYMSPERCLGEDYSFQSDLWSVGMIVYELSCGKHPFADAQSFPALFNCLCEKPEPRLDQASVPPELYDFVACCLTRDAENRSDTSTLSQHPFVVAGEPVEVLTASIEFSTANDGVNVICCDLGGAEKLRATFETDANIATFEFRLRENFPGYRKLLDDGGMQVGVGGFLKDYVPRLTFTVANAALAKYVTALLPSSRSP